MHIQYRLSNLFLLLKLCLVYVRLCVLCWELFMDNGAIFLPNVNNLIMLSIIRWLHVQLRTVCFLLISTKLLKVCVLLEFIWTPCFAIFTCTWVPVLDVINMHHCRLMECCVPYVFHTVVTSPGASPCLSAGRSDVMNGRLFMLIHAIM